MDLEVVGEGERGAGRARGLRGPASLDGSADFKRRLYVGGRGRLWAGGGGGDV